MKTEGFISNGIFYFINSLFIVIFLFSLNLNAYESKAAITLGGGWKSDFDPSFSFRSASDIFKRYKAKSSATMIFSAEGGLQSENESGFFFDIFAEGLVSLQSVENSTLFSGIDGGYVHSFNENSMIAVLSGLNYSAFDYISLKSLFVNPRLSFSYIYDSLSFYTIFLRSGLGYFIPTDSIIEYLNGPSLFVETGFRLNFNNYGIIDWFAGNSYSFFNNQKIKYNRYDDVYYGELNIDGSYFSFYSGIYYAWNKSIFTLPVSLKYIFSRSFDRDVHKIVYWNDVGIPSRIYEKVRIDNTIEFSIGTVFKISENFSLRGDYLLHKNFSNVGKDFGDYADYSRIAHTFSVEICYEY